MSRQVKEKLKNTQNIPTNGDMEQGSWELDDFVTKYLLALWLPFINF